MWLQGLVLVAFRRGYPAEMELVELLRQQGFHALRVPVSGGRGFPCDVLAAKGGDRRAYEVKVTRERVLYLYEEDVKGLVEFCRSFGFQAYIAVRYMIYFPKRPYRILLSSKPKTVEQMVKSNDATRLQKELKFPNFSWLRLVE